MDRFLFKIQFYGTILPMKPTMIMIKKSLSLYILLGGEIIDDGNWEAVYGCGDK